MSHWFLVRLATAAQYAIVPAVLLLGWFLATTTFHLVHPALLPSPKAVYRSFLQLVRTGELEQNIVSSLLRIFYANLVALLTAVPIGLALGLSPVLMRLFGGLLSAIRPIPPLAWIPLAILWFGIGETSVLFITFLSAFFAIFLNTLAGVRAVDPLLLRAAASLGASRRRVVTHVILPSVASYIFTGVRIAIGVSWMSIVAAELVAATSGLGYMIAYYREALRTDAILVGMVVIGLIGLLMDIASREIERRLLPWRT